MYLELTLPPAPWVLFPDEDELPRSQCELLCSCSTVGGDHLSDLCRTKGQKEEEVGRFVDNFVEALDVDEELANELVEEGFTSLEEIAYVPLEEMVAIDGFDEDLVEELRKRAKDKLLNQAIASEEALEGSEPAQDLLNMDGMERHLAFVLASKGIVSMEDLAEQSVDDLIDIEGIDEERAGQLIMTARAPWFENQ